MDIFKNKKSFIEYLEGEKYVSFGILDPKYEIHNEIIDNTIKFLNQGDALTESNWLEFETNKDLFNKEAKKNCRIMFADGSECNFNDEHPMDVVTHFKVVVEDDIICASADHDKVYCPHMCDEGICDSKEPCEGQEKRV